MPGSPDDADDGRKHRGGLGQQTAAEDRVSTVLDHRVMLGAAQMMIHDPWGMCIGSASEMRGFAEILDAQAGVLAGIYARRAGRPVDEMRALMAAETWLTDTGAVEAGLADEVIDPTIAPTPAPSAAVAPTAATTAPVAPIVAVTGIEPPAPAGFPTSAAEALLAAFSAEEQS